MGRKKNRGKKAGAFLAAYHPGAPPMYKFPKIFADGPVALFHTPGQTLLAAYEHGADHPDSFFDFSIDEGSEGRGLELTARKGNYYAGQPLEPALRVG